ncbi:pseudouridine synthase [Mycoplasma marinum]|uniref:Pseudouridine synthase n=1 Tax=Mycoplasma marinum TaxID=1937190 RepID=A0A4R0XL42_9MOLU|nr:pseudouridine synthase [Mycoplasma marinum]TCG11363.1 16S rRNA pseudouridine(516) synthase [Mycoplasma marinum]
MKIRLDKFLTQEGIGSRSQVKTYIKSKRVFINGIPQKDPKFKVDISTDKVEFNHKEVKYQEFIYIALNKPKGYVCANKDNVSSTVFDLIPGYEHRNLFVVGRLDKDTTGLVLITDDGQWAHKLKSPKSNTDKEYFVTLREELTENQLKAFQKPMTLDDKKLKPGKIKKLDKYTCNVILSEGKFHQVKCMFHKINNNVIELHRTRIKDMELINFKIKQGEFVEFTPKL